MSKRKSLSISDKLTIIGEVDTGVKNIDIATKYSISPSSVSTIVKKRDLILKLPSAVPKDRKRIRLCVYDDIDKEVLKWISLVRNNNGYISNSSIKKKALHYAKQMNILNFQASSGWLEKFKKRNGLGKQAYSRKNVSDK